MKKNLDRWSLERLKLYSLHGQWNERSTCPLLDAQNAIKISNNIDWLKTEILFLFILADCIDLQLLKITHRMEALF